jgi:hypothetical protein
MITRQYAQHTWLGHWKILKLFNMLYLKKNLASVFDVESQTITLLDHTRQQLYWYVLRHFTRHVCTWLNNHLSDMGTSHVTPIMSVPQSSDLNQLHLLYGDGSNKTFILILKHNFMTT